MSRSVFAFVCALLLALSRTASAADTYAVDPAHTSIGFSISHMVINKVHGTFDKFQGTILVGPGTPLALQAVTGSIEVASIDTRIGKRDDHLRSPDFFDAAKFPEITFRSTKVEKHDNESVLVGEFTMHGVTREVRAPVTIAGPIKDPMGKTRIGLAAKLTLNRKDYGLTWNKLLEAGGVMVGEEVEIEINAEAVKQESAAPAK